jgi:hypothetical protein
MAPYRNRLVVIDAVQFDPYRIPWPEGVTPAPASTLAVTDPHFIPPGTPIVSTPHGVILLHAGDWILTRKNGEKYICLNEMFHALWEPHQESPIVTIN